MPFVELNTLEERELVPGFRARFIHSENMTFSYWDVESGAALPEHSHPHEQVTNIFEGEFELVIDGKAAVLKPGMAAVVPSNAVHSGKALTPCKILDVFYPVREEYR